jgi:outer membrane protein
MMHVRSRTPTSTHPRRRQTARAVAAVAATVLALTPLDAQSPSATSGQVINLTFERMAQLGLAGSYRVQQLGLDVERTRYNLLAQEAGLKSRVQLSLSAPRFESISDYQWNSELQRNELVHQDTRRWEANLSVRQPVILFGYPTNGELSFTNRIYRYTQNENGHETNYYNRYFFGYDQPLFQPNRMKNGLENARLDLKNSELQYVGDVVGLVADYGDDYYRLFRAAYDRVIAEERVSHLDAVAAAAAEVSGTDPTRAIEGDQVQVELANAREDLQQAISSFRLRTEDLKQSLRLSPDVELRLEPVLDVTPVPIDADRAIELARTLRPRLQQLAIQRRKNEISIDNTRGDNAFRMDLSMTYGREVQDPSFNGLWSEPTNSYTVNITAFVPIWDSGRQKYREAASQVTLKRTDLQIEQEETQLETNVRSQIRNLDEYEQRALGMQENMQLAHQVTTSTLARYRQGDVTLVDLLQTINRETNTADNFLDAFVGYRQALLRLQELTFYDFEHGMPVAERFGIKLEPNDRP